MPCSSQAFVWITETDHQVFHQTGHHVFLRQASALYMHADLEQSTRDLASSKGSDKTRLQKTRCNFWPILSRVISEDFCAQNILSLEFMHIYTDDQRTS